jgi:hypothetical protein
MEEGRGEKEAKEIIRDFSFSKRPETPKTPLLRERWAWLGS